MESALIFRVNRVYLIREGGNGGVNRGTEKVFMVYL